MRLTAMSVSALAMMHSTRSFVLPLKPPLAPITRCLSRTRCQRISSRAHPARNAAAVTHVAAASPGSPPPLLGRGREVRCNAATGNRVAVAVVIVLIVRRREIRIETMSVIRPTGRLRNIACRTNSHLGVYHTPLLQ